MASDFESPVGQFRSRVQWFLEGMTPTYQSELNIDLLVSLKGLAIQIRLIKSDDPEVNASIERYANSLDGFTRRQLEDVKHLDEVLKLLKSIAEVKNPPLTDNKSYRDVLVQTIMIAETHPDISFRKRVLQLTEEIT